MFTVLFLAFNVGIGTTANHAERELHTKLFMNYNPDVKPMLNVSEPVNIYLKLYLMSIDNIDERKQSFSVRAFMEIRWIDEYLTWRPEEFSNVTAINVPNERIWQPDLALDNVYNSPTDLGQKYGRAVIENNGSVTIWPYKMYTVACKIKIHYFPFDVQECFLDLLSWTNPSSAMRLLSYPGREISFDSYQKNGEWALDWYNVTLYQHPYGNDSWDNVKFTFSFRRKWLFQVMNIIAPIVCISLLNLTCFLLPAESGEKITLCISIFLTLAVFLTTVTSFLPESSDEVSILGIYVCIQLFGSGLSVVCTVISLVLYHRDQELPVPHIFLWVCKIFCQTKRIKHSIKYQPQTGLGPPYVQESGSNNRSFTLPVTESDVSWTTVSRAFDRLCFTVSVCWNVVLLTGLVIAYSE